MERTKKVSVIIDKDKPASDKIRWRKQGGGSARLRIDGIKRIIKPGEVFLASPGDIPEHFRDIIIPLEAIKVVEEPDVKGKVSTYNILPRGKSKSMFDVVDSNGKRMNDPPLSKDAAEKFKKSLES